MLRRDLICFLVAGVCLCPHHAHASNPNDPHPVDEESNMQRFNLRIYYDGATVKSTYPHQYHASMSLPFDLSDIIRHTAMLTIRFHSSRVSQYELDDEANVRVKYKSSCSMNSKCGNDDHFATAIDDDMFFVVPESGSSSERLGQYVSREKLVHRQRPKHDSVVVVQSDANQQEHESSSYTCAVTSVRWLARHIVNVWGNSYTCPHTTQALIENLGNKTVPTNNIVLVADQFRDTTGSDYGGDTILEAFDPNSQAYELDPNVFITEHRLLTTSGRKYLNRNSKLTIPLNDGFQSPCDKYYELNTSALHATDSFDDLEHRNHGPMHFMVTLIPDRTLAVGSIHFHLNNMHVEKQNFSHTVGKHQKLTFLMRNFIDVHYTETKRFTTVKSTRLVELEYSIRNPKDYDVNFRINVFCDMLLLKQHETNVSEISSTRNDGMLQLHGKLTNQDVLNFKCELRFVK